MSKDTSEEKALPASDKKLRDERRKGRTAQSRDLISSAGLLVVAMFLWLTWPTIRDHVVDLARVASDYNATPFDELAPRAIALTIRFLLLLSASLAALILLAAGVAGIVGSSGPVFSFDPIKPNFDHVNPAKGLQRIFSLKNVVEFAKSLVKVVVLGAALWLVLRNWLQPLFETPACSSQCFTPMILAILKPIVVTAVLFFIAMALLDVLLQRWLFLRDMRMTRTEAKREHKELEGDPIFRRKRRRMQQQLAEMPRLGVQHATVVITSSDQTIGVRYNAKDTPLPMIVARSQGQKGAENREEARRLGIPIVNDPALAMGLFKDHRPGDTIGTGHFEKVAYLLFDMNLL